MRRSAARILLVILAGMIMILGVSGCMSKKQESQVEASKPTPEEIKAQVETYLLEKYSEEFVPVSFSGSNWAYSYNKMYWYPKSGSESDRFEVRVVINKDGSRDISDGYFGILIAPQYSEVVSGLVKEIYKDFKFSIKFGEGVYPDRLNKDTKMEEIYNENENFSADISIFVKEDSAEGKDPQESLKRIAEKMIERKLVADVLVYTVYNDKFDSFTMDALSSAKKRNEFFIGDYHILMIGKDLEIMKIR